MYVRRENGGLAFLTLPSGKVMCVFHPTGHTPDRVITKDQIHCWSEAKKLPTLFRNGAEYNITEEGDDFFVVNIGGETLRYNFEFPNEHWKHAQTKLDLPKVSFRRTRGLVQVLYLIDGTEQEEADAIASSQSHFFT